MYMYIYMYIYIHVYIYMYNTSGYFDHHSANISALTLDVDRCVVATVEQGLNPKH